MRYLFFFYISLLISPINAQKTSIEDAIKQSLVQVNAVSKGGHSGECLRITLINLSKRSQHIVLSPGDYLASDDSTTQNLLLVDAGEYRLQANQKRTFLVTAFCCTKFKSSPNDGGNYQWKGKIEAKLAKTAEYLYNNGLQNNEMAQEAIWAVSDGASLASIHDAKLKDKSRDLIEFIAKITNQKTPWYRAEFKKSKPGPQMRKRKMLKINAEWSFELSTKAVLDFAVFDSTGKQVSVFFSKKDYEAGKYTFLFSYETNKLNSGVYFFRMTDANKKIIQEKTIQI